MPLTTAVPAGAGSAGGATTVTPGRSPLSACEWPTRTPGTSVIALRAPGSSRPTGPAMSRQRSARRASGAWPPRGLGVVQQAGGELVAPAPASQQRRVDACRRARSAAGSAGGSGSRGGIAVGVGELAREQLALAHRRPASATGTAVTSAWV